MKRDNSKHVALTGIGAERRMLLKAAAGLIPIPFLSSLVAGRAEAAPTVGNPIFVGVFENHSTLHAAHIAPTTLGPVETRVYAGHTIRRSPLVSSVVNGQRQLSRVLAGPEGLFTPALLAKMNVIRGCDWPRPMAHNSAQLGAQVMAGIALTDAPQNRSVDVILQRSPSFYRGPFTGITKMAMCNHYMAPFSFEPAAMGLANVPAPQRTDNAGQVYDMFFRNFAQPPPARTPVVDLMKESYQRLGRDGGLASADKRRLDDHVDRIADLDRRLRLTRPTGCVLPSRPTFMPAPILMGDGGLRQPDILEDQAGADAVLDVLVAALSCGLTRIALLPIDGSFGGRLYDDWHQIVEHRATEIDANGAMPIQDLHVAGSQLAFASGALRLASKLDAVIEPNGKTLLDRCLVARIGQMGEHDHNTFGSVITTFGSADGAMTTGQYLDYRNLERAPLVIGNPAALIAPQYFGLTKHQFFGSLLQLLGVPLAEFAETSHPGFGARTADNEPLFTTIYAARSSDYFTPAIWSVTGEVLPWLMA